MAESCRQVFTDTSGYATVLWNPRDEPGLSPGLYFYHLRIETKDWQKVEIGKGRIVVLSPQ